MAKGRKLTTSQSERFLGSYACGNARGFSSAAAGDDDDSPYLAEDDLWPIDIDPADSDSDGEKATARENFIGAWAPRASAERVDGAVGIPIRRVGGEGTRAGGLTLAFDCEAASPGIVHRRGGAARGPRGGGGGQVAASAPVNVPDWSKIYRVDSAESMQDSDDGAEEEEGVVPPHEYLARGRRVGATSVFEGVGRTLKGRDLRRVRDAVWSQTGFDG